MMAEPDVCEATAAISELCLALDEAPALCFTHPKRADS